jgi:hypothetical protein
MSDAEAIEHLVGMQAQEPRFVSDEALVMGKKEDQSGRPKARCRCLRG